MLDYRYIGKKDHAMKKYQTINYIEKNLDGLSQDSINSYSYSLGLIYKWMTLALEARKKDIISRLHESKQKREEREQKIDEDKQRTEERKAATDEAREKWENENAAAIQKYEDYAAAIEGGTTPDLEEGEDPPTKPSFDEKFFLYNWDEEHPAINIPPEVIDDVDNDWIISADKKDDLIADFAVNRQEELAAL